MADEARWGELFSSDWYLIWRHESGCRTGQFLGEAPIRGIQAKLAPISWHQAYSVGARSLVACSSRSQEEELRDIEEFGQEEEDGIAIGGEEPLGDPWGEVPETTETGSGPAFSAEASSGPHESMEVSVGPANGEGLLAGIERSVGPGAPRETATGPDYAGGLEAGVEVSVGRGAGIDACCGCMLLRGVDMACGPEAEAQA